jgi:hypothetical protein
MPALSQRSGTQEENSDEGSGELHRARWIAFKRTQRTDLTEL